MKKKLFVLVLAVCMVFMMAGCGADDPVADCKNGNFVGQVEDSGVMSFKGIPYAKAPTGDLRWKAPEAPEESDETFEAKEFGKTSVQYSWHSEPAGENPAGVGEDCLTLNVWRMRNAGHTVSIICNRYLCFCGYLQST